MKHVLITAPAELQGIKFDEDSGKALELAQWLIQSHGVLVLSKYSAEEWAAWYSRTFPSSARAMEPDSLVATGSLIRGSLLNLARGEE